MERLPWRLAALAGMLVGAISAMGGTDVWQCLYRVGGAFAAFGALGLLLRAALRAVTPPVSPPPPRSIPEETPEETE